MNTKDNRKTLDALYEQAKKNSHRLYLKREQAFGYMQGMNKAFEAVKAVNFDDSADKFACSDVLLECYEDAVDSFVKATNDWRKMDNVASYYFAMRYHLNVK